MDIYTLQDGSIKNGIINMNSQDERLHPRVHLGLICNKSINIPVNDIMIVFTLNQRYSPPGL